MSRIILHAGPEKCGSTSIQKAILGRGADLGGLMAGVKLKPREITQLNCETPSPEAKAHFHALIKQAQAANPGKVLVLTHEMLFKMTDALTNRALRLPIIGTTALNLYTSRTAIAHHLRREIFAVEDRVDAARVEHHYLSSHQPGSHLALAALLSGYLNHDAQPALARLDQPVWLAWGRQSIVPSVESADLWLNRLRQAEVEVFEQAGSHPHLERPQVFADALTAFLDRVTESSPVTSTGPVSPPHRPQKP